MDQTADLPVTVATETHRDGSDVSKPALVLLEDLKISR
jgi:hypothetical protein